VEKHLLVAVSEDKRALYGARFVGHFFSNKEGMKITLFYTTPKPPQLWENERSHETVAQQQEQARQYEKKGRRALESGRAELRAHGFKDEQLESKLLARRYSKVMDIVQEAHMGLYDAVVLGRRGLSWIEEAFEESVTKGILEQEFTFPIWMCRQHDLERRNVLVCVDGSDESLRIVDHVGFMLRDEPGHDVTLLMVDTGKSAEGREPEAVLAKSRDTLLANGVPEERVRNLVLKGSNVIKTIKKEAEEGRYAVVAVGRTGAGQGLLQKIFMGSVSWGLFRELEGLTLWVSR